VNGVWEWRDRVDYWRSGKELGKFGCMIKPDDPSHCPFFLDLWEELFIDD
jgi:hypothetical protein